MKAWVNLGRVVGVLVALLLLSSTVHAAEFSALHFLPV
jgi:hypothetical protein